MYGSLIYSCGPAKRAIDLRCYQRFDDVRAGRDLMKSMGMPRYQRRKMESKIRMEAFKPFSGVSGHRHTTMTAHDSGYMVSACSVALPLAGTR